jgi:hypothetical protein
VKELKTVGDGRLELKVGLIGLQPRVGKVRFVKIEPAGDRTSWRTVADFKGQTTAARGPDKAKRTPVSRGGDASAVAGLLDENITRLIEPVGPELPCEVRKKRVDDAMRGGHEMACRSVRPTSI